jgi:hypothetical protein
MTTSGETKTGKLAAVTLTFRIAAVAVIVGALIYIVGALLQSLAAVNVAAVFIISGVVAALVNSAIWLIRNMVTR